MENSNQAGSSSEASSCENNKITINVKFSGRSIALSVSPDSTIKDVKSLLQPLTNVLPRGQKLIFKGKVLVDSVTVRASELTNGARLMLMASQGLHQGDGPILKQAQTRPIRNTERAGLTEKGKNEIPLGKSRLERWKTTGVIALSESHLKAISDEVWQCGSSARVLDLSNNFLLEVPAKVSCLSSLQKLILNANGLSDQSLSWEGLTSLTSLTVLSLNQNNFTTIPPAIGALPSLRQLFVTHNKLTSLPTEIGLLVNLEVLKANSNRISNVPPSIGNCKALTEIDLSSNFLSELPETFGNLQNLKALHLSNNGLKSLPSTLFKMCLQLSTLDLHNTEITIDLLRQFEGWGEFDERRRSKHQKQLEFRVMGSADFDEGADKN